MLIPKVLFAGGHSPAGICSDTAAHVCVSSLKYPLGVTSALSSGREVCGALSGAWRHPSRLLKELCQLGIYYLVCRASKHVPAPAVPKTYYLFCNRMHLSSFLLSKDVGFALSCGWELALTNRVAVEWRHFCSVCSIVHFSVRVLS